MVKMLICFINPNLSLIFILKCMSRATVLYHKSRCSYSTEVWPIVNYTGIRFLLLTDLWGFVSVVVTELPVLCTCLY